MNAVDVPLALPWIAFAVTWAALSIAVVAAHRLAQRKLAAIEPAPRASLLFAMATLPFTVAALVAVLGFAPSVGGLIVDGHCHDDVGCWPHVPMLRADAGSALLLDTLLIGISAVFIWIVARTSHRSFSLARTLNRFAEDAERRPYKTIETHEPIACCVGLWKPQLLVSRGLIAMLSQQQLAVVVAHERGHALRRDNLTRWLANLSLRPLPRRMSGQLIGDLSLAGEQACDRLAAEVAGGIDAVVQTLRALDPSTRGARVSTAAPFGAPSTIEHRVVALRGGSRRALPPALIPLTTITVYWASLLTAGYVAHHGAERLLAFL